MRILLLLGFGLLIGNGAAATEAPISRILFGSCARESDPQPIWEAVLAQRPELFILTGDNIYGDTEDMDVLRAKYRQLGAQPGYRRLQETCPVLAVWDDHDYGMNDAGSEYPMKEESQRAFLEFFRDPAGSPRWTRPGVYDARIFGPPGQRVQVILLDTRYFRDPLKTTVTETGRKRYLPLTDPAATLLGEAQWAWMGEQLREPAELRLIVTGIQVIPDEHGSEKWANLPLERTRLLGLIRDSGANGVVFISGDRHHAELSRMGPEQNPQVAYPLFEVTSSGLTRQAGRVSLTDSNRFRIGNGYGLINFGMIEVDWTAPDPIVQLRVHDGAGRAVIAQTLTLGALR